MNFKQEIILAVVILGLAAAVIFVMGKLSPAPLAVILQVPFSSQAPSGNWESNEDCEETSLVMVNEFLSGNTQNVLPQNLAQAAIDDLKKWEQENLGYHQDTSAEVTARLASTFYNLQINQIDNFSEQNLKKELALGHPILLPVNAGLLGSPKYRNVAPFYHMIVVRGYTNKGFIVNDPGTEDGNGNVYSFSILKKAAVDWNHDTMKMEPSIKTALVVYK